MHPNERQGNPINPVIPAGLPDNRFPDPHIKIFVNPDTGREAMYMYVGHDEGFNQFIMRDWYVMWSEDLVTWHWKKALHGKAQPPPTSWTP